MKKLILNFILIFTVNCFSQVENEIINMFGISNSLGNKFLIYEENKPVWNHLDGKKINVIDLKNNVDSTIFEETGWWQTGEYGVSYIQDYDFYNNISNNFAYIKNNGMGYGDFIYSSYFEIEHKQYFCLCSQLIINTSRSNLLYLTTSDPGGYATSIDSGKTWPIIFNSRGDIMIETIPYNLLSLYPKSDSIMFGIDSLGNLIKSYNAGLTSEIVEESGNWEFLHENLFYDKDEKHIYGITQKDNVYYLYVSNNFGKKDSWNLLFSNPQKISISVDQAISGKFTFSADTIIYQSTDFGQSYQSTYSLNDKIVGIFNISNSDTIYAATRFTIWEIINGNQIHIKQVISKELLSYYPLQIGNKWYYDVTYVPVWTTESYQYILTKEVVKDTLLNNEIKYFVIKESRSDTNLVNFYFERIDSVNAQIYRLQNNVSNNEEYLVADFHSEFEESFSTFVNYFEEYEIDSMSLHEETYKDVFTGKKILKRFTKIFNNINSDPTKYFSQSYSREIGKTYQIKGYLDGYDEYQTLSAAFLDGYKYGDTILVGIKNSKTKSIPTSFSLYQNYPNPFNPSTTIEYSIPQSVMLNSFQHLNNSEIPNQVRDDNVKLNVYDILGREVATLVNQKQKPGNYKIDFDANQLSSGIYLYQLKSGAFIQTKKMIVLK